MNENMGSKRHDYIWNMTDGLISAAEAVIMSMIVTRATILSEAGVGLIVKYIC